MCEHPKVFISYSQDNKQHADRVLHFSNQLRNEGIDTILDQYESFPAEGWTRWMDKNIRDADFVLMVCTETYYQRVMGEEQGGVGLGIRWEGHLIYQHLYQSGTKSMKFIPIIFDEQDRTFIPTPVQSYSNFLVTDLDQYDRLYWVIRRVQTSVKPALGNLRPLPEKERKSLWITGFIEADLWNKAVWKGTAFSHDRGLKEPPKMALLFESKEFAGEIFKGWIDRLGGTDEQNELRISIVEGEIQGEDSGYTVHISANIENIMNHSSNNVSLSPDDMLMVMTRFNRMYPERGSNHLEYFKERYAQFGSYLIVPGVVTNEGVEIMHDLDIHKREIHLRKVAEITSKSDLDSVLLPQYRDKK